MICFLLYFFLIEERRRRRVSRPPFKKQTTNVLPCTEQTKTQSGFLPSIQKKLKVSTTTKTQSSGVCLPLICFWFSLQKLCVHNSFCFACMRHSFVFVCMRVFCDWEKESSGVMSKNNDDEDSVPGLWCLNLLYLSSLSLNSDDGMWWNFKRSVWILRRCETVFDKPPPLGLSVSPYWSKQKSLAHYFSS